jgi:hypothetical protein
MKALLLTVVILAGAMGSRVAQKKSTLMGDIVIGELTARDEVTREVTIKYPGKEGPEIFSGILVDGYKVKMGDGKNRDFNAWASTRTFESVMAELEKRMKARSRNSKK